MGGRSWTVSTGNQTSTGFSTSHDLRPAVQGALTAQGVKGVFAAGNTTQALRNWAEMTISTEPATPQIYTFPGATPQGIQPPEGYGGNPNQPIWQEWFDDNSGLGVGSGYFPGGSGDNSWFIPYLSADYFITTPSGITLPPNQNFDLVPTHPAGAMPDKIDEKWFQIHGDHEHDGMDIHTHYPEINVSPTGKGITERRYNLTTDVDIERVNKALQSGEMRLRRGRKDKGGTP